MAGLLHSPSWDGLPNELRDCILGAYLQSCHSQKNDVLRTRLVCHYFDFILRPYVFKTIQLEFSSLPRVSFNESSDDAESRRDAIKGVGHLCEALYCDMMIVRDTEEIEHLLRVFKPILPKIPEMARFIESLRHFCMQQQVTSNSYDYKAVLDEVLEHTPNLTRLALNLPLQMVGKATKTACLLLADTFQSLASRICANKPLEVLVLDHISDSMVCYESVLRTDQVEVVLRGLRSFVLALKRQERSVRISQRFATYLWQFLGLPQSLESLCLIGRNTKRPLNGRIGCLDTHNWPEEGEWQARSLPYPPVGNVQGLKHLRYLELKLVDVDPSAFIRMIDENSESLKELYLNQVYLKVSGPISMKPPCLWIGHAPASSRPEGAIWIAEYLREKESLKLEIVRATDLGYDTQLDDESSKTLAKKLDLDDPSGKSRSFDLRFVDAVMGVAAPLSTLVTGHVNSAEASPQVTFCFPPKHFYEVEAHQQTLYLYGTNLKFKPFCETLETATTQVQDERLSSYQVLAKTYFPRDNNTTSHFKRSIDGIFYNNNERPLAELRRIVEVLDMADNVLNAEVERIAREAGSESQAENS